MDFFTFDNLISDDNYVRIIDAFVDSLNLDDFKLFAFDGTKIKANCSKKHAFTLEKITLALANIDDKINEYISKIDDDTSSFDATQKF